ncbi:terminase small subunit [bacterium]|nr:terminase small subunit [bacterium]
MRSLTAKQKLFVSEYLADLNATQAALRAGYSTRNADKIGSELLGKTRIAEAVAAALEDRERRTLITADYVLRTIKTELETCIADPEHKSADVYKGCELLGKHLKLFTDRVEAKSDEVITLRWQSSGPEEIAG